MKKFGFDRRAVIAAPIMTGNKVLIGGRDGFGYCLDKNTGKQLWRIDHEGIMDHICDGCKRTISPLQVRQTGILYKALTWKQESSFGNFMP